MENAKKRSILAPLSASFCATVLAVSGCVASNVAVLAVSPSQAFAATESSSSDSDLPPVRETLSEEEAKKMEGCEAYFDSAKHEFVIRPKNGANEGVISYSLDNKKADFEAIRQVLIFKGDSDEVPVRFDKRVYIYDSTDATANDTLFYQVHVKTINITDNLNIKFAKNLAKFFMQNYNKTADHLHYIKGVENWDTSNVESMEKMFNLASQLEGKLDLSRWNVSNTDKLNLMFSGVGNDNFVLDFSNKNFKNSADVTNMFNSFGGILIANNWTVKDPNGTVNPIQNLMNSTSSILTHWNGSAYTGPSWHLLITDNPTILEKNKTAKYKFYKKVKVIYKTNGAEKSVELELPAVYDSRIDAKGNPDASKAASNDPMQVVRPQIDAAVKQAVKDLRNQNPTLNLPENVIPVPVHDLKDAKSPIELFQDYYLGLVKEETTKAKTTYTADPKLEYKKVEYDTQPQDGKKQVITGAMKDGAWDPDATSEKEITKAVDGKARVGNKKVETEEIQPGTTYEADNKLDYKKEQTTEGTKGTKTTTTIYNVDENTGLTNTVQSSESKTTTAAKDKVIKVGNVEKKTSDIPFKKTYEGNEALTYQKQETKTAGQNGKEEVTLTYKVDAKTGLTSEVEAKKGLCTQPVNEVIQVGNKEVIQNNDGSTTTKTYKVNPNDGTLSDPTVVTSRPWTDIASGASVSEVLKGKMTYVADESLPYGQTKKESDPKDGEKITTPTGKVENGKWVEGEPKVEIKAAVNGVTKVGNKEVKTEEIQPGTKYEADSSLDYKKEQTTEGAKGTKTTTTIYKVDENTGLTNTVQSSESKTTTAAKDKVIKVGNVKTETEVIKFKTTYIADDTLAYEAKEDKTAGKDGSKTVTTTYKVDKTTGLSADVESTQEKKVDPTGHVVRVGNKQVTHEGDKTITTTYDVDPNTGKLTNPKKHTSMPAGTLTPPDQLQKTVTFKDGDKQVASVKVEKGKAISTDGFTSQSMPENPTKSGYTFKGWNTQQDGQGTTFTGTTPVNSDLTVYAVYTKNPVTPPQPQPPTPPTPPAPNPNPDDHGTGGSGNTSDGNGDDNNSGSDNNGGNDDHNNGGGSVAPDSTDNPELNIGGGNDGNTNNDGNGGDANNTNNTNNTNGSGVGGNATNGAINGSANGSANGISNGASVNANVSASGVANRMGSSKSRTAGTRSTAALPSTGSSISGVTFASFGALVFGMFSAGAAVNRKRAKHLR
ncbi:G5 domain-containing protein [Gardnerella piotii]|uniref:G5 domain-containing protein n=1 Tax=Gardnerella piotii TaxID=2792977 RepID=UPI003CE4705D